MRNYTHFDRYLNKLIDDCYPQPEDEVQKEYAQTVINTWFTEKTVSLFDKQVDNVDQFIYTHVSFGENKTVLDLGCGQGMCQPMFQNLGWQWEGVVLGLEDYNYCKNLNLNVFQDDFTFLPYADNKFLAGFSRHSIEHSPFLLITLMEWNRVIEKYLCVILPNPNGYGGDKTKAVGYRGKNHYSVIPREQFIWLANRAGWKLICEDIIDFEMRFLLEKSVEITG